MARETVAALMNCGRAPMIVAIFMRVIKSSALFSVNLTAVANGENQDNPFLVLDVAQDSVVSNSISPESGPITSREPCTTRIVLFPVVGICCDHFTVVQSALSRKSFSYQNQPLFKAL